MNRDRRHSRKVSYPPIRWDWCPACRKRGYNDEGDALVVASRAAWSGTQRVYECPRFPGHYHLTSKPKRGKP